LLDDHELVREGVRSLLESDEDIEVVGEASTSAEAIERIPLAKPMWPYWMSSRGWQWYRSLSRCPLDHAELVCLMLTSFC